MYNSLKKITFAIVPKALRNRLYSPMRNLATLPYKGSTFQCNVCDIGLRRFVQLNNSASDLLCPMCGSLPRKRFLLTFLAQEDFGAALDWLHFTPSQGLKNWLSQRVKGHYVTTDYETELEEQQWDIQNLPVGDASFDRIVCYHVLEHVPDDVKAIAELFRVLKPGGVAFLQVPFGTEFDEDPTVADPNERLRRFGQVDHVRYYTMEVFRNRLQAAGFEVAVEGPLDHLETGEVSRLGLDPHEVLVVASRPH